jgi:pyrimidine operon attenuation protein/uracil phosphoribosyltransferase
MALKARYPVMSAEDIRHTLEAMASEILKSNPDHPIILLGIERRGGPLAWRLSNIIKSKGATVLVGKLDINLYRDDLTMVSAQPVVRKTELPTDIRDKDVILVDDVLYTGRTIRAAMEALNDYGRVRSLQLAVLVDRGHRELPIQPNFVGRTLESQQDEIIEVRLTEVDGEDGAWIMDRVQE